MGDSTAAEGDETVGEVLGLRHSGAIADGLALIDALDAGLPLAAVDGVAARIAPHDHAFRFKLVPRATLARRDGKGKPLSSEQGAKVARLAKTWVAARHVWQDADAARAFLRRPHPLLGGMTPLDVVLRSEFGGPIVEGILRRLEHGTAA